jgi:hypothetical protein
MAVPVDALEERILMRIPREIAAGAVLAGLGAGLLFGLPTALFVLAGGLVSAASFLWMKQGLFRVLAKGKREALRSGLALYGLRFVLILLIFSFIILSYPRRLLAFVAGFSTVIPVFLMEAVRALSQLRPWKS